MTQTPPALEERLDRLEAGQARLLASTTKLEELIDLMRQEFQRTATNVARQGLVQESNKTATNRLESLLEDVRGQLRAIVVSIDGKPPS